MKIKQAIIPAAGLGSRFLPITKTTPKELLPLVDKPCLQHVIEEGVRAGIEEFIIVISKEKTIIKDYFTPDDRLNSWLERREKTEYLELLKSIEGQAKYQFVYQDEPLGLGHAVNCGRDLITEDYFMVILPDDIIDADVGVCGQMIEAFQQAQKPMLSVMQVSWEHVHRYGIVEATPLTELEGDVKSIVEKPNRQDAPSNLAVIGRYLLPKKVFDYIDQTEPGAGGEIQLTDALKNVISDFGLHSFAFVGERFDTGNPVGLLKASIALSLKNPDYKKEISDQIKILASAL